MNEIERLKNKNYVRAFGLMSVEKQKCLQKAGKENCLRYDETWKEATSSIWYLTTTYAIKPDYQPEYVDLEIKEEKAGFFHVKYNNNLPYCFSHSNNTLPLHCLSSLPGFVEFWYDNGVRFAFTDDGRVATFIDEGKTVYARFRK